METNKNNQAQPIENEENVLSKVIKWRKALIWAFVIFVVIVATFFIISFVKSDKAAKVDELVGKSDIEMNDSIALTLKEQAAALGTKSGNRAALEVAIAAYQAADYEKALDYLKKASVESNIIEAGRYALMGDCYANTDKLDDAVDCFKKAIKEADNNPQIVPFVLIKLANVYNAQGKYSEAYDAYQNILANYPQYVNALMSSGVDVNKLVARAKAQAEK